MDKDFNKEYPSSNEDLFKDTENQDSFYSDYQLEEIENIIMRNKIEILQEELHETQRALSYLEQFSNFPVSELQPSVSALKCSVSPVTPPIHEPQDVFEDEYENLPHSAKIVGSLEQPNVVSPNTDALERKVANVLPVYSNVTSNKLLSLESMFERQIRQCLAKNSPAKTLHDETQAVGSHTETQFKIPPHLEFTEKSAAPCGNYNCKGKEAAIPKYRYKKRSKSDVSCRKSPVMNSPIEHAEAFGTPELDPSAKGAPVKQPEETFGTPELDPSAKGAPVKQPEETFGTPESSGKKSPVQCSEEAIVTPESKVLDSESRKTELTRISPAVKRKESESRNEDHDNQQLEESCARAPIISKLFGNLSEGDGNLIIRKKIKFEDDEKVSRQYPIQTANLSKKNDEGIDFAEVESQDQAELSHERDFISLASSSNQSSHLSSDLSSKIGSISTSKESSFESDAEDVLLCERRESCLTSESDASVNEKEELFFMNVSDSSPGESSES